MRVYEYIHKDLHDAIGLENVTHVEWQGSASNSVLVYFAGTDKLQLVADDGDGAEALYKDLVEALRAAE